MFIAGFLGFDSAWYIVGLPKMFLNKPLDEWRCVFCSQNEESLELSCKENLEGRQDPVASQGIYKKI